VAEVFTGFPGKFVELKDTVSGFKSIIEGKYDEYPESAFYMVGSIEEVEEKAKRLLLEADSGSTKKAVAGAPEQQTKRVKLWGEGKFAVPLLSESVFKEAMADYQTFFDKKVEETTKAIKSGFDADEAKEQEDGFKDDVTAWKTRLTAYEEMFVELIREAEGKPANKEKLWMFDTPKEKLADFVLQHRGKIDPGPTVLNEALLVSQAHKENKPLSTESQAYYDRMAVLKEALKPANPANLMKGNA
jgi:hypothetical protein